jgi:hypothetical protein
MSKEASEDDSHLSHPSRTQIKANERKPEYVVVCKLLI